MLSRNICDKLLIINRYERLPMQLFQIHLSFYCLPECDRVLVREAVVFIAERNPILYVPACVFVFPGKDVMWVRTLGSADPASEVVPL
jgi:hypothetical protein